MDNLSYGETNDERLNETNVRLTVLEADIRDGMQVLDETTDQLRYGLMELGGFMRDQALTAAQRRHRFIQEVANFVLWQMKQRNPDTTDEVQHGHHEGGESEVATDDEEPGASTPATGLTRLLSVLRGEQNAALAKEAFSDASQIQHAILAVLGATSGDEPAGFTIPLANEIRNIFQRLFRSARNRGEDERATSYRRYVDDLHGLQGLEFTSYGMQRKEATLLVLRRSAKEFHVHPCQG